MNGILERYDIRYLGRWFRSIGYDRSFFYHVNVLFLAGFLGTASTLELPPQRHILMDYTHSSAVKRIARCQGGGSLDFGGVWMV